MTERTLILIKPDGVQRALIGKIIDRYEARGLRIVGMKMVHADRALSVVGCCAAELGEVVDHRLEVDLAAVGFVRAESEADEVVAPRREERVRPDRVGRAELESLAAEEDVDDVRALRRGGVVRVRQRLVHPELQEHLVEVVLDRARRDFLGRQRLL